MSARLRRGGAAGMRGAGLIFFAYIGFDAVSTATQEAKDPQRTVPVGILGSLAICTILYVTFPLVLTGMASYRAMQGDAAPVATAIARTPYRDDVILSRSPHRCYKGAITALTKG
jgi:APA family basic amino acid/polyamine antiporter